MKKNNVFYILVLFTLLSISLTACGDRDSIESVETTINESANDFSTTTNKVTDIETTKRDNITTTTTIINEEITTLIETTPATSVIVTAAPTTINTVTETILQPQTTTAKQEISYTVSLRLPEASGSQVQTMNGYSIDYSNVSKGYVMVKNTTGVKTYLWIIKDGVTYQYKMQNTGGFETYPLSQGSGNYTIRVLAIGDDGLGYDKNTLDISVGLESEMMPFLYASTMVDYNYGSNAVNTAYEITASASTDAEKVNIIYNYIVSHIVYNYDRANSITSGALKNYVPSPENTINSGQGICSDYASLMACMCRAVGIPTKMVYGYVNNNAYHAWNQVYYDGSWHFFDACIAATGGRGSNYNQDKQY